MPDEPDEQDLAEVFDETNITPDGEDIATSDMQADVFDATSAEDDADEDDEADEDFDPDEADEEEPEEMLELSDGIGEERSFRADDGARVDSEDDQPEDYEAGSPADNQLSAVDNYDEPSEADLALERRLDQSLKDTFPASDPVSITPPPK